jgi:hypothetical protein
VVQPSDRALWWPTCPRSGPWRRCPNSRCIWSGRARMSPRNPRAGG